jgi:hypothetical protein
VARLHVSVVRLAHHRIAIVVFIVDASTPQVG